MSILDIIIFSIAGIFIAIYAYFEIRRTMKWKKLVKEHLKNGLTLEQAKDLANKEIYKKKYAKLAKKNKKQLEDDIYEE